MSKKYRQRRRERMMKRLAKKAMRRQRLLERAERHIKATTGYDKHHRRPKSRGGSNNHPNCVVVPRDRHKLWHLMWHNYTVEEIKTELETLWLDPDWTIILVPKRFVASHRGKCT